MHQLLYISWLIISLNTFIFLLLIILFNQVSHFQLLPYVNVMMNELNQWWDSFVNISSNRCDFRQQYILCRHNGFFSIRESMLLLSITVTTSKKKKRVSDNFGMSSLQHYYWQWTPSHVPTSNKFSWRVKICNYGWSQSQSMYVVPVITERQQIGSILCLFHNIVIKSLHSNILL